MKRDYIDIVKNIVLKHVPQNEFAVFLFGSRAVGNASTLSDIDVGILGIFEYCAELAWKISKMHLELFEGILSNSPKGVYKTMFIRIR